MRTSMLFERISRYVLNKKNITNVIFYLIGLGVLCFYYGFKVMLLMILFMLSIATLSEVLMEGYLYVSSRQKKLERSFFIAIFFFIIISPFSILLLNFKVLAYVLILSFIIVGIGIYFNKKW